MSDSIDVYGIGNAVMDVEVRVDDAFLEQIGAEKGGMRLVDAERQAELFAALEGIPVHRCSGGSVANSIAGIADLGGTPGFLGRVAQDETGEAYVAGLRDIGVHVDGEPRSGTTGTCMVMVTPDAQRTMLTCLGAAAELDTEDVTLAAIDGSQYLYVEGYLFAGDGTRAAALAAIERATAAGVKVALTVSDPFVIDLARDLFWELVRGPVNLLFCNEQEARSLTGREDPIDCAKVVHEHAENVALTLGANGSLLMHDGEVHPIEGVPTEQVDTTGAGDMYAAGILYGITNGLDWPTAGHLASHAASLIVGQMGARLPRKFSPEEIRGMARRS